MINGKIKSIRDVVEERKYDVIEDIQVQTYGGEEREESINEKIRSNYSLADELKVHRKAISIILSKIGVSNAEFDNLCKSIEEAKNETDEMITMRERYESQTF